MPRPVRLAPAEFCYHVINRGNGRAEVFHKPDDYQAFLRILSLACERHDMRLLAWCLMPNHFHFVAWPRRDNDLPRLMQWLTTCHVRRHHRHYKGNGHVWQGRYKSFIAEGGKHLLAVLKYVERNPVRAGLVKRAEHWPWSSAAAWAEMGSGSRRVPDPISGDAEAEPGPRRTSKARGASHPFMMLLRLAVQASRLIKQITAGTHPEVHNKLKREPRSPYSDITRVDKQLSAMLKET